MATADKQGLASLGDTGAIEKLCDDAVGANPCSAADFRAGNAAALNFPKGQVMMLSKGMANPALAGEILERKLKSYGRASFRASPSFRSIPIGERPPDERIGFRHGGRGGRILGAVLGTAAHCPGDHWTVPPTAEGDRRAGARGWRGERIAWPTGVKSGRRPSGPDGRILCAALGMAVRRPDGQKSASPTDEGDRHRGDQSRRGDWIASPTGARAGHRRCSPGGRIPGAVRSETVRRWRGQRAVRPTDADGPHTVALVGQAGHGGAAAPGAQPRRARGVKSVLASLAARFLQPGHGGLAARQAASPRNRDLFHRALQSYPGNLEARSARLAQPPRV
jgi:hypothetical protein